MRYWTRVNSTGNTTPKKRHSSKKKPYKPVTSSSLLEGKRPRPISYRRIHCGRNPPNQPDFFSLATESLSSTSSSKTFCKFINVKTFITFSLMLQSRSLAFSSLQRVEKWINFPIIADDMKLTFSKLTTILSFSFLIKSSSSSPRPVMRASSMMLMSWK